MEDTKLTRLLQEIAFLRHDPEYAQTYSMIEAELNKSAEAPDPCSSMECGLSLPADYPR